MSALTSDEAQTLANRCDEWPPGLGFVIEPYTNARGWRRVPGYRPFMPPAQSDGEEVRYCPVVQLHERRRSGDSERSYYAGHLDAFWTIIAALQEVWQVGREEAHQRYNELLKTDPHLLALALWRYGG